MGSLKQAGTFLDNGIYSPSMADLTKPKEYFQEQDFTQAVMAVGSQSPTFKDFQFQKQEEKQKRKAKKKVKTPAKKNSRGVGQRSSGKKGSE